MFRNYFMTALRNLTKHKTFSLINILGLGVGMGCVILISLLVIDDLSYDKFHVNADHIYRIVTDHYIGTPAALAPALERNLPEISEVIRFDNFTRRTKKLFRYEEKMFFESRFVLADPSIFKAFSFRFLKGNPETAMIIPNSIIMTKSVAEKYFGEDDPIGKTLTLENKWDFIVTGLLEDIPENTHLKFDLLAPFSFNRREDRYGKNIDQNWGQSNFVTYFLLAEGSSIETTALEEKVNRIYNESGGARYKRQFFLQSLRDIHLSSNLRAEFEANSSMKNVVFFVVIGFIILLIACLNSMNLSTARSIKRAKEVGIRKAVGAERSQLVFQFFGESFIMSVFALIMALFLVAIFLPAFNALTGKNLHLLDSALSILAISIITVLVTSIGSGIYPALVLSSFQPVKVFKSMMLLRAGGSVLRKILVVAQFSLSIIFLICTFVVWNQLNFIKRKNLGLNKDHIVNIPLPQAVREKYEFIKNDIQRNPAAIRTAASNFPAFSPNHHGLWWEGMSKDDDKSMFWFGVDHDFIETLEMEIIEGRNFSRTLSTDTMAAYIFNESAVREFGEEFIQVRKFSLFGRDNAALVIGVVKDFHFMPLHEEIVPLALCINPRSFSHISVRVNSQSIPEVLGHIREVWKKHLPNRPFEYFFLDDRFDRMYKSEQRLGKIFSYFAFLAIFISCLGLFALASFMAEQRTKEIGVRKILGASVMSITVLLSKEFSKWVLLANLFAWPVAYYVMKKWLDNFAYRTNFGIEIFFLSGLLALGIALLTVSYQSIKAALSNPIDTLRYE